MSKSIEAITIPMAIPERRIMNNSDTEIRVKELLNRDCSRATELLCKQFRLMLANLQMISNDTYGKNYQLSKLI